MLGLCGLNVTLALVVFAGDTSDGILLLFKREFVRGFLPLLGHGLDGSATVGSHEVEDTRGDTEGGKNTAKCLGALTRRSEGLARAMGAKRDKVSGLLLVKAELLPVLPLKLFQLTENTVLLLLGQGLPAGLNVGDDVAKLDLVGALDEGACVACGLESPSLFLGDQGSSAKEGSRAETASGSASNVLADHDSKVMRMNDTQKYEEMRDRKSVV